MTNNAEQALEALNNIPPFMGKQSQEACTKFINEHGKTIRQALKERAELEELLNQQVKYLNGVASLIEARNPPDSLIVTDLAQPLKVKAFGLHKTLQKHKDIGGVE